MMFITKHSVMAKDDRIGLVCPFCRAPTNASDSEHVERAKKRIEAGDAAAMHHLGSNYHHGRMGLPQDYQKAMELWLRAGELGFAMAYYTRWSSLFQRGRRQKWT